MKKLFVMILAVAVVFGMSAGVMASDYDYENESSRFDVDVNIDTYAEFDLDDVNVATDDGIEPGEDGDNTVAKGTIVANYDYKISVASDGLKDEDGNELEGVEYYAADYEPDKWVMSKETFNPGHDHGDSHSFNFYDERERGFEFGVNFDDDKSWEEFTAGEYSDTIEVTLEAQ